MNPEDVLKEIAEQVSKCTNCALHFSRNHAVPGEGSAQAEIMFIGEGPGFHENEQGRPFVGQAGKFLDELLTEAGLNREEVFICNVVKCRPPGNRDPLPEELSACAEFLDRQSATIKPVVIVTLGRISMSKYLFNARISEIHGRPVWVKDQLIIPMYHPAAALHQPSLKTTVINDFKQLSRAIEEAKSVRKTPLTTELGLADEHTLPSENPEQLTLF